MKKILYTSFIIIAIVGGCKSTKDIAKVTTPPAPAPVDCAEKVVTFNTDIKQVFEQHCISCHGYGGAGGYNFESRTDIDRAATSGDLLSTIKWMAGYPKMPANAPQLDQATITKIECWINTGMK